MQRWLLPDDWEVFSKAAVCHPTKSPNPLVIQTLATSTSCSRWWFVATWSLQVKTTPYLASPSRTTNTMAPSQTMKSNLDLINECDRYVASPSPPKTSGLRISTLTFTPSFPYIDILSLTTSDRPQGAYYAFYLPGDARPHGFLPSSVVEQMPWTPDFVVSPPGALPRTVTLLDTSSPSGASSTGTSAAAAACNASLSAVVRLAQEKGLFAKTLGRKAAGEDFRIMGYHPPRSPEHGDIVQLRRSAAPLFGIANRGAHMTVYTRDPATGAYRFWTPRRSAHLATYPGMLDNTVAGGVRAEETPLECILHEADEEASLPADFVRRHVRAAGAVTYVTQTGSGGGVDNKDDNNETRAAGADADAQTSVGGFDTGLCVPDVLYCYDLEIPADQAGAVVPAPRDDEVECFYLWDLDTTRAALARGEFKPNTALVLLDFFVRHGLLTEEDEPDYVEILARLHRRLPVPTATAAAAAAAKAP